MLCVIALAVPASADALSLPIVDPTAPAARDTEPVVLTGSAWATGRRRPTRRPSSRSPTSRTARPSTSSAPHNHYAQPEVDSGDALGDGHPGRPPARLPLGSGREALRADPVPGRRAVHAAIWTTRPRASRSTRARTSTRPTPTTARASAGTTTSPTTPAAARPDARVAKDPVAGPRRQRRAGLHGLGRRPAGARRCDAAGRDRGGPGRPRRRPDRAVGHARRRLRDRTREAGRPEARVRRVQRLRLLRARRERRHASSSRSPTTTATATRARGPVLRRRRQPRAQRRRYAEDRPAPPARLRDGHDPALQASATTAAG